MGREKRALRFVTVVGSVLLVGCDLTGGMMGTGRIVEGPKSVDLGVAAEARAHLPRDYHWILGGETVHLIRADKGSNTDQWRVGVVGGFNPLKRPEGSILSYELTGQLGYFRGGFGDAPSVGAGAYGGARFGVPIRVTCDKDPWQEDAYLNGQILVVPWVGSSFLVPRLAFDDGRLELAGGLAARVTLSSTLFP